MTRDLQKADLWKRIAAWLFDGILTGILAVGLGFLLSVLLGYDAQSAILDDAQTRYEAQYGITFDISQETYQQMTETERAAYDAAYEALCGDEAAMRAYTMLLNLSLVITSGGIFLAVLLWEFLMPLWLGEGRTLGKKIFSLCVVRNDSVRVNSLQLFARAVLGKYAVETMIPVSMLLMLFWGTMDLTGTLVILALALGQLLCLILTSANCAIHDLLAGTVVVDYSSQRIFRSTEELIAYQKQRAAEQAARAAY